MVMASDTPAVQGQGTAALLPDSPLPSASCGGFHTVSAEQYEHLLAAIERSDRLAAEEMPDEAAALRVLQRAYGRLEKLGFRNAIYCPKDGSVFDVIEAGSTGIHDCHYEGEWPEGSWWVHADGDLYPSRPILFRPKPPLDSTP